MRRTYVKDGYEHAVDFETLPAGVYDQVVELVEKLFKDHGWRRDIGFNPNEVADERNATADELGESRGPGPRGVGR